VRITALQTFSFRNLAAAEVNTSASDIFLVGENGQGKTNFLEAVYFSSYASSFRGASDRELVQKPQKMDAEGCSVIANFTNGSRVLVKIENNKKPVLIDGKKAEDRKELLAVCPCIVFCHEDMAFVSGTPEERRWFFDQTQSLYDPIYLDDLRNFRKILKMRNNVLKDQPNSAMLDALDSQLVTYGINIMQKRAEAAQTFSRIFAPLYEVVSGINNISIAYKSSWKSYEMEGLLDFLKERRESDRLFGSTMTGPHRDRYIYMRGDTEFARNASTGQRRLLALLLRTAQARRFSDTTGKKPVLLLDDVLLELDPEKRRRFIGVLPEYDQAFYTFLPEEPYQRYIKEDSLVYRVVDGLFETL
jgi:DNA replication and repair protein RecF